MSAEPSGRDLADQRGKALSVVVANAPVSYGAFEITVGVDPHVPDPVTLLDWVSAAGYKGIDLGPIGYLVSSAGHPVEQSDRVGNVGVDADGDLERAVADRGVRHEYR